MHSKEISVSARYSGMAEMLSWLAAAAVEAGLDPLHSHRVQLVVEELFANTLMHGFAGEDDSLIRLALITGAHGIRLIYSDAAPPFDPTRAPGREYDIERPGGFGLNVIRSVASALAYAYRDGRNEIVLDFNLHP